MFLSIYDTDPNSRQRLKELFVSYSMKYNKNFDLLWITELDAIEKSKAYLLSGSVAFISLDSAGAETYADLVYSQNSDIRICYYKKEPCDILPLLNTRPIGFYLFDENSRVFYQKINDIFEDILKSRAYFHYSTRTCIYCYPICNITYISSDLKYVVVHKTDGSEDRIYAKLTDIEARLQGNFVRIHKSYLLNPLFVRQIDKRSHSACLVNGEVLSISDPYYQGVLDYFS